MQLFVHTYEQVTSFVLQGHEWLTRPLPGLTLLPLYGAVYYEQLKRGLRVVKQSFENDLSLC